MKEKLKHLLALLTLCLMVHVAVAQVTGTVKGEDGEPMPGVSVVVKNSGTGVITSYDGTYSISAKEGDVLLFAFIGMATQEVKVAGSTVDVIMRESSQSIEDVIVVAYGTTTKASFTGSASTIKAEVIEKRQASNITTTLSGTVAGVQGLSFNGEPGSASTIRIRGVGSINAGNSPLYVVDGVPYDGDISAINNADVESVTVLKDAASNALYGARGANGVIMVTTKRGKTGEAKVNVDSKWGTNRRAVPNYNVMTDPGMYYETAYTALWNSFANPTYETTYNQLFNTLGYNIYTVPDGERVIGYNGKLNPNATLGRTDGNLTYLPDDWYAELFDKNNLRQEYNVNVSGATDKLNYYISAGYLNDGGIIEGSGFDRFTSRIKGDYQAKKWLKLGGNFSISESSSFSPNADYGNLSSGNLFYFSNYIAPIYPLYVRDAEGNIMKDSRGWDIYDYGDGKIFPDQRAFTGSGNPAAAYKMDKSQAKTEDFSAKWFADVELYDGLKLTGNWGTNIYNSRYTYLANPYYGQYALMGGYAYVSSTRNASFDQNYLLTYTKEFGEHSIDLLVGYDSYRRTMSSLSGTQFKLFDPTVPELSNTINSPSVGSSTRTYATLGYLAQAKYDYADKYFVSASFRRDASSVFDPKNRWGNFWSVGAAYNLSKENFMSDLSFVDLLKVKASYGQQGNDYLYYTGSSARNYFAYQDQYEIMKSDDNIATALYYKGNRDITWETSNMINAGVEFELFDKKLTGSVEYFNRRTSDMLYNMPTSPSLGYNSFPMNVGVMSNYGVEVDLSGEVYRSNDITVTLTANITFLRNKINELEESLNGEWISGTRIFKEGESMYNLYLRNYAGVNKETGVSLWYISEEDAEKSNATTIDMPDGRLATPTYAYATRYATGNTMPTEFGGFGATVEAYGFDFSFQFGYQMGGRIIDYSYQALMHNLAGNSAGVNWHKDILKAWTPENPNTDVPRLNSNDNYMSALSDRFLVSSNYLSLQNITFGYTLPKKLTEKLQISSLRVYAVADNVALWAARKGLDPRQGYASSEALYYSPMRSISGGVKLTF